MTVFQLLGGGAGGKCHELMPKTHRKHHHIGIINLFQLRNDLHIIRRIAGTVGQHHAVKSALKNHLCRRMCRESRDLTAALLQAADHILLDAQIQKRNSGTAAGINLHLRTGGFFHRALDPICPNQLQLCLHIRILLHGNHAVHGALIPQKPGDGAGIYAADAGDPVAL